MRLVLDFDQSEAALVADALYAHRQHLAVGGYDHNPDHWMQVQQAVETKFVSAGLPGVMIPKEKVIR